MPALGQYPVLPARMAAQAASMTLDGVGRFMSPRWKGYTVCPSALCPAARAATAKAVSVPSRAILSAVRMVSSHLSLKISDSMKRQVLR